MSTVSGREQKWRKPRHASLAEANGDPPEKISHLKRKSLDVLCIILCIWCNGQHQSA
jgi:hypothetical protein